MENGQKGSERFLVLSVKFTAILNCETLWRFTSEQIECGLAWCGLLSTTVRVITVVKMLWAHDEQPSESATIGQNTLHSISSSALNFHGSN